MITPGNRLFCRLDGLSGAAREQQRMLGMAELGLLESENVPVFEEATQIAARFLGSPICIFSLLDQEHQWFKAAVGLSQLGFMNELASDRQIPRSESFCDYVVDSQQILVINDTFAQPLFANTPLVHQYGIRAYVGVPLITSNGVCLGTLAVMDLKPRHFDDREIEFLELTARWSISEYERKQNAKSVQKQRPASLGDPKLPLSNALVAKQLKVELLSQLTQELRTPLTSILGMASVLTQKIYGPLTAKQKEYLDIVHHSGQYMLSIVNEILELSNLQDGGQDLNLALVDIKMLCQQIINTLKPTAQRREQQIYLSVEPGRRVWPMDKDKVRQMLYHLLLNIIQSSTAESIVRLHVSSRKTDLNIAIWVSHPWLGEGLPQPDLSSYTALAAHLQTELTPIHTAESPAKSSTRIHLPEADAAAAALPTKECLTKQQITAAKKMGGDDSRNLSLLLSQHLAELHGGKITIQGTADLGYRCVVCLPQAV